MARLSVSGILVMAGGALAVVGWFLPWATAGSQAGTISISGVEGGTNGLVFGIVALVLGGAMSLGSRHPAMLGAGAAIIGGLLAFIAGMEMREVNDRVAGLDPALMTGSVGLGLYLVLAAAGLCVAGGFVAWAEGPSATQAGATAIGRGRPGPVEGTIADALLQRDVLLPLRIVDLAELPEEARAGWHVVGAEVLENPQLSADGRRIVGPWSERWTVESGGMRRAHTIVFTPERGGTSYSIETPAEP
jgi:hypothetical protein